MQFRHSQVLLANVHNQTLATFAQKIYVIKGTVGGARVVVLAVVVVYLVCCCFQECCRRHLQFTVPRVVSVSPQMRLVEDHTSNITLADIFKQVYIYYIRRSQHCAGVQ